MFERKISSGPTLFFVMERNHRGRLINKFRELVDRQRLVVLEIPDEYQYMDPELVELLETRAGWHLERLGAEAPEHSKDDESDGCES